MGCDLSVLEKMVDNLKYKLKTLPDRVSTLEVKLTGLENRDSTTAGFTAYFPNGVTTLPKIKKIMKNFINVTCNFGNHFDPTTCIFTAPINGVYAVYCSMSQLTDGEADVSINRKQANPEAGDLDSEWVCVVGTSISRTSASGFALVEMCSGDFLYVEVASKVGDVKLNSLTSFSCFRIG